MGFGASTVRVSCAALVAASCALACGGMSQTIDSDDGSAAEGGTGGTSGSASEGGTSYGGTGANVGGSVAVGGSVSSGGASGGVAGVIVTSGTSGATGVGGAMPCPVCPDAMYGVVIEGDGMPYDMTYNGSIGLQVPGEPPRCPDEPIRGTVGGCGRSIFLSVCEDPVSGPPCFELTGGAARYVDRQTGALWSGRVTSDLPLTAPPGVTSGTLTVDLVNAEGDGLTLTVTYTFCAPLGTLRIVC